MGKETWKRRDAFFMSRRQEPNYRCILSFQCCLTRRVYRSAWSKVDFSKKFLIRATNCIMPTPHLVLGGKQADGITVRTQEAVGLVHDLTKNLLPPTNSATATRHNQTCPGNREWIDKRLNLPVNLAFFSHPETTGIQRPSFGLQPVLHPLKSRPLWIRKLGPMQNHSPPRLFV